MHLSNGWREVSYLSWIDLKSRRAFLSTFNHIIPIRTPWFSTLFGYWCPYLYPLLLLFLAIENCNNDNIAVISVSRVIIDIFVFLHAELSQGLHPATQHYTRFVENDDQQQQFSQETPLHFVSHYHILVMNSLFVLFLASIAVCCQAWVTPSVKPARNTRMQLQSSALGMTLGSKHGENSCFLPLQQLDQDYYAPRIVQVCCVMAVLVWLCSLQEKALTHPPFNHHYHRLQERILG